MALSDMDQFVARTQNYGRSYAKSWNEFFDMTGTEKVDEVAANKASIAITIIGAFTGSGGTVGMSLQVGRQGVAALGIERMAALRALALAGSITVVMSSTDDDDKPPESSGNKTPSSQPQTQSQGIKLTKEMNSRAEPIARGSAIDKVETLKRLFGGKTTDWSKMKTVDAAGREVHFYQGPNGMKVGMKYEGQPDPF